MHRIPNGCIASDADAVGGRAFRLWVRPLWQHGLALLVVLLVGYIAIQPSVAYSSDEGSVVLQARLLERGDGWLYESPISRFDPTDQARPFVRGDAGLKGVAPYAKHPLYPIVIAAAERIGGTVGVGMVGVLATLGAALLAALLARRLGSQDDRVVLWLVGVGSPLFFDTYLVLAHGLAAAMVTAAFVLAVIYGRGGQSHLHAVLTLVGILLAVMVGAMFRTEAIFVGPAIGFVALILFGLRRIPLLRAGQLAIAALIGSAAAFFIERIWILAIIGTPKSGVPNAQPSSWIQGRIDALHLTWFSPSRQGDVTGDVVLFVAVILLAVAGIATRRQHRGMRMVPLLVSAAAVAYVIRLVVVGPDLIPGLVIAFPAGWFLAWACGRRIFDGVGMPLVVLSGMFVAFAVLLTQYSIGGGIEWGGRYFAIIVPIIGVVTVIGAIPMVAKLDAESVRIVISGLVVASLVTSMMALVMIRRTHVATASLMDEISAAASDAGPAGEFDRPIVISTNRLLPQISYRDFDEYVWVVPEAEVLVPIVERLGDSGVNRAVLATDDAAGLVSALPGWHIEEMRPDLGWDVAVIARS